LCAEQLVTRRDRKGFAYREWQKMRERNEALDCYVYARAAATAAGLDRFEDRHWSELEKQIGVTKKSVDVNHAAAETIEQRGALTASTGRRSRQPIKSRWA